MNIESLIEKKVDTLFTELHQELRIFTGDIAPEDQNKLDMINSELSTLLYQIIDYQMEA